MPILRWIILSIVICGLILGTIIVVYTPQFAPGGCVCVPNAGLVPTAFSNPTPNNTTNGGGWIVVVETISTATDAWKTINVIMMHDTINVAIMNGVTTSSADLHGITNSKTKSSGWYLKKAPSVSMDQIKFSDGTGAPAETLKDESPNLVLDRFETVQGASFIVVDTNYDGFVTAGDFIVIFADPNADGTKEIAGPGYSLAINMEGGQIGSAQVGYP